MLESHDLKDFSITNWYKDFEEVTLKTIIIEITPALLNLLRSDDFDDNIEGACDAEYVNRLKEALKVFDNKAFVKNNWHAPLDAKFMSLSNLLQVNCVDDILTYFKASDIVAGDLEHNKFDPYCIALREYINIHPATEFRCVVIADILRGITPRDWPTFYEHFAEEGTNVIRLISDFFQLHLKDKFYRKNYVFDVIVTYPEKVQLVDFGPLNKKTTLYAFLWDEIESLIKTNPQEMVPPVFRYLDADRGIMLRPKMK